MIRSHGLDFGKGKAANLQRLECRQWHVRLGLDPGRQDCLHLGHWEEPNDMDHGR